MLALGRAGIRRLLEIQNSVLTSMKKAFITGITGQDGSYLAEFLLARATRSTASSAAPAPSTPTASTTCTRTRTCMA